MNSSFLKRLLIILFFIQSIVVFSQDSKALANAYLAKAQESFSKKDKINTEKYLNKSIQYFGEVESKELSLLATKFYVVNKDYPKAKKYANQYFKIEKDINSKEYNEMLIAFIEIEDNIESGEVEQEKTITVTELKKDTSAVVPSIKKRAKREVKGRGKIGKTLRETYQLSKKYFQQKNYTLAGENIAAFFSLNPKKETRFYKEISELKTKVLKEVKATIKPSIKAPVISEVDEKEVEETIIESTETDEEIAQDVNVRDVPFVIIEEVPVFPGCSGTRKEKADCLKLSLQKHVQKNFNANLASELKLSPGKKKIWIAFRINEQGKVLLTSVRAPHPKLKDEGSRIVGLIPKMEPGKQRGKPVGMKYTLPITFNVKGETEKKNKDN